MDKINIIIVTIITLYIITVLAIGGHQQPTKEQCNQLFNQQ